MKTQRRPRQTLPFLPAEKRPVTLQVADQLRDEIAQGELRPGERLPSIAALAAAFDVSVPTMAAAIAALTHAGLVRCEHGVGTFVARNDDLDLLPLALRRARPAHFHALRRDLELAAVRRVAQHRTDHDLSRIAFELNELRRTLFSLDRFDIAEADVALHRVLVQAAHNPLLTYLHRTMARRLRASAAASIGHAIRAADVMAAHEAVVEAIEAGRPEVAAGALARVLTVEAGAGA